MTDKATQTTKKRTQSKKKTHGPKAGKEKKSQSTQARKRNADRKNDAATHEPEERAFWEEARENISEGARVVGETVEEYSEKFMNALKAKASEAYKLSSEFTLDAVHKAQDIIDNYRDKFEVRKLSEQRDEKSAKLGLSLYHAIKENKGRLPENFIDKKATHAMLMEIEEIDRMILELTHEDLEK